MSIYRHSSNLGRFIARTALLAQETRTIKRWVAPTMRVLMARRKKIGPEEPQPRSSFLEWNYDAEVYAFGKRLGEEFREDILKRALLHRSYCNQRKGEGADEESKDNVELIEEGGRFIKECVRNVYGKYPETIFDSIEAYLLSEGVLSHVASYMGLKDIVLTAEFPVENSTLADSFKAVVAALLRSSDEERAKHFVKDLLFVQMINKDIYEVWNPEAPYEKLISLLKERGIPKLEPRLCSQSASNTILANYQVGLYSDKKLMGIGWGESVENAKETAAMDALKRLYGLHK